jgi:hypothetical protein
MSTIERRLNKLEEIRDRNDVGSEVDNALEKMGTSRAAMLADFGSLTAFRDWLAARIAATDHQAGVPIAALSKVARRLRGIREMGCDS